MNKCQHENCRNASMKNDNFCYFHSPAEATRKKRASASRKGGINRHVRIVVEKIENVNSYEDIKQILLESLNLLRTSKTTSTVSKARTVTYICTLLAELVSRHDIEDRLSKIEAQLATKVEN